MTLEKIKELKMSSPLCPKCSERLTRLPPGNKWQCVRCKASFSEKELANPEAEKNNIVSIISSLNRAKSETVDYVGLNPKLRDEAQKHFLEILSKPLNNWQEFEAELYRAYVNYPGRSEYVRLVDHHNLHKIEHSLSVLCELSQAQLQALGGVGNAIGGIKVGTTISGLNAARNLGESLGEGMI